MPPRPNSQLDPRVAHLQLLEATAAQSSSDLVVSHASAAVLHGLPIGNDQLDRVHLTQDRHGQGRIRRYVHVHGAPLGADEVIEVEGFRVTSLSRTVLDLACALRPLLAVPIGDAALRAGMTTDELAQRLGSSRTDRHGIARARRTATLLDPRSESPGESMSRVVFAEHRVPLPTRSSRFSTGWAASSPGATSAGRRRGPWASSTGSRSTADCC